MEQNSGKERYINRELSWLEFNRRVLFEADDEETPLLERLKFLSIFCSNLDEFYMVRVGGLQTKYEMAPEDKRDQLQDKLGWTVAEQLEGIQERVEEMSRQAVTIWKRLSGQLKAIGIDLVTLGQENSLERLIAEKYFNEEIRPLLSPQIMDSSHPFPFLKNKENYILAVLSGKNDKEKYSIVPLTNLPPCYLVNVDKRQKLFFTSDIVQYFLPEIYRHFTVKQSAVIRVTRSADIDVDESILEADTSVDFRGVMENLLKKRRRLFVVRIQCRGDLTDSMKKYLCGKMDLDGTEFISQAMPLDFSFGFRLPGMLPKEYERFLDPPQQIVRVPHFERKESIRYVESHDLLLSFPFQSVQPFVDLLYDAADDPEVMAIKISLYRLANNSKIVAALMHAADQGKEVHCILELRARFDEQSNIDYSKILEDAGCHVIYGLPDYKIHAKVCLIIRKHHGHVSYITQIGTGNYNEKTSEQYTDLSLITADQTIGADASHMFSSVSMGNPPSQTDSLWVAPYGFKPNVLKMIDEEIERQKAAGDGYIAIKVNSMNDKDVMDKLAEASCAGVEIHLYIRGICCLRPGIPGFTENISVRSVVGRWLEHSRIFWFGRDARARVYIGSGDLLERNTTRRIEVFTPVNSADLRRDVWEILEAFRTDRRKAWDMQPDGSYVKEPPLDSSTNSQEREQAYFARKQAQPLPKKSGLGQFFSRFRGHKA